MTKAPSIKEALERALDYLEGDAPMHSRGGHRNEELRAEIKSALATLSQPTADRGEIVARSAAWPAHCHNPNSCERHRRCMYIGCVWRDTDIKAALDGGR